MIAVSCWRWWDMLKVSFQGLFLWFTPEFFSSLRCVGCWQVKTFSRLWTAFWRGSATSNNWSPPGPKIYLRTTVREVPPRPPPPPRLPRLPLLPPRTPLLTAPQPPPPPAPPPPATSTWRCSVRRRRRQRRKRRRQRAMRRYRWTERRRRRAPRSPGAGEEAWSVMQEIKTAIKSSFIYRAYRITQAI